MRLLHSKTASKAGASLWIPTGRGAQPNLQKIKSAQIDAANPNKTGVGLWL
jgi:hypothetical protein